MKKMTKSITLITFLLLCISAKTAEAGIFKCVSKTGKTYYVDKPCSADNEETELKAVKDPVNGYIPPEFVPDKGQINNTGVVVGSDSNSVINKNDRSTSENSNQDQSQDQASDFGTANTSESINEAAKLTESDKAFNAKLKEKPSTTKDKGKISASEKNVLELEPPGEAS